MSKTFSFHLKGISSLKIQKDQKVKCSLRRISEASAADTKTSVTAASFLEAAFACFKDYQSIRDKKEMSKTALAAAFVSDRSHDTIMSSARAVTSNILWTI